MLFERILFGRTRVRRELPPGPLADGYEVVALRLERPDGVVLCGWQARPKVAVEHTRVLLYFGGRNEDVCWAPKMASYLAGWTIYAFNYRGMGDSGGTPSEQAVQADALALYALVRQQLGADIATLALMGRSLGTAVAVWLAHQVQPDRLVLLSPFCHLGSVLRTRWWSVPLALVVRRRFASLALAPQIGARALVLLAEQDDRVFHRDSLRLAQALAGTVQTGMVAGTTHRTLPRSADTQHRLAAFLQDAPPV